MTSTVDSMHIPGLSNWNFSITRWEAIKASLENAIRQVDVKAVRNLLVMVDPADILKNNSLLIEAIFSLNEDLVKLLLDAGFRPDLYSSDHDSWPLMEAAARGSIAISTMLIERHLHQLSLPQNFDPPLLSLPVFIDATGATHTTPLMTATSLGHLPVAELLLQYGADINRQDTNGDTPLHLAIYQKSDHLFFPLFSAIEQFNPNIENAHSQTPLMAAAARNLSGAIEALINFPKTLINQINQNGACALHFAASNNSEVTMQLLSRGAKIEQSDLSRGENERLFYNLLSFDRLDEIRFLVEKTGFDLSLEKDNEFSLFFYSKTNNRKKFTLYLKENAPEVYKSGKEIFKRKKLAHLTDTDGLTTLSPLGDFSKPVKIRLGYFNAKYMFRFMAKRADEFLKQNPEAPHALITSLADTAQFQIRSASEIMQRWQEGEPVYMSAGTNEHFVGLLIFNDHMVWIDRHVGKLPDAFYNSCHFDKELLTEDIIRSITNGNISIAEKRAFLKQELPKLINAETSLFDQILENTRVYAQKFNISNCTWVNSQALQLPHSVLYEMDKLWARRALLSKEEIQAVFEQQAVLCDALFSYYQHYLINKELCRIRERRSCYEPDIGLVARAFIACYPYANNNAYPELTKLWQVTEKTFVACMPKKIVAAFRRQKLEEQFLKDKLAKINSFIREYRQAFATLPPIKRPAANLPPIKLPAFSLPQPNCEPPLKRRKREFLPAVESENTVSSPLLSKRLPIMPHLRSASSSFEAHVTSLTRNPAQNLPFQPNQYSAFKPVARNHF